MDFNLWPMANENIPIPGDAGTVSATKSPARMRTLFTLRAVDVPLYRLCDALSGILIFLMVVFSPWAFGTTQSWSIWTMNLAGYALGILLLVKLFIREVKGYPALRWEKFSPLSGPHSGRRNTTARQIT